FPAPLGPRSPYIPRGMVSDTSLSARTPFGYVFERLRMASCMWKREVRGAECEAEKSEWCGARSRSPGFQLRRPRRGRLQDDLERIPRRHGAAGAACGLEDPLGGAAAQ